MCLRCVIVDDEYLAIKILEGYVAKMPQLQLLQSFKNPLEAIAFLEKEPADVLFLDIQMPHMNGIELLTELTHKPLVIFTTARHEFAVQAFELDVLDYLVKPISEERFTKAVLKAEEYLSYKKQAVAQSSPTPAFLMIKCDYKIIKLSLNEITLVEGYGEYVKITAGDKKYITLMALKDLENRMPTSDFVRIHKSYIVSLKNIRSYNQSHIEMNTGLFLPVGRSYKETALPQIKKVMGN